MGNPVIEMLEEESVPLLEAADLDFPSTGVLPEEYEVPQQKPWLRLDK